MGLSLEFMKCYACDGRLSERESDYSETHFDYPICIDCQDEIRSTEDDSTTGLAKWLWIELRRRGVPAELEKYDGFKTIDLAITEARLNIEVDGKHHQNFSQAMSDLKRTTHSLEKGYITLRIPNALIEESSAKKLDEIVDYIVRCCEASRDRC